MAEVQNEFRAKRAVQHLAEVASPQATVMRDGELMHVEAAYAFAGTRGLRSAQQGSLAFAARMIVHVALAFVSRSDREPLASVARSPTASPMLGRCRRRYSCWWVCTFKASLPGSTSRPFPSGFCF